MTSLVIAIASDHSGYPLKQLLINYFNQKNLSVKDLGPNNSDISVDYPDYAKKVVDAITERVANIGILICATGIGMSIVANRSSNIRAALCINPFMAERARAHNDANILVLGNKLTEDSAVYEIVDKFFSTTFEGGRHIARLNKIK